MENRFHGYFADPEFIVPSKQWEVDYYDEECGCIREVWMEEWEEPLCLIELMNSHRFGDKVRVLPRSNVPANPDLALQIAKEYKRGEHPKEGVFRGIYRDYHRGVWFEILTMHEGEPREVFLAFKYWMFE